MELELGDLRSNIGVFRSVLSFSELCNVGVSLALNPFAPGDFAEKRVLKLVEWFSGHCRAIKS